MSDQDLRTNPYVGLRPFFIEDSLYFFGREQQTAELLDILREHRFLGVVGSSGSGKSSLVRAGLLPALLGGFLVRDRDRWRTVQMKPGDAPISNLAAGLFKAVGQTPTPDALTQLEREIRESHTDAVIEFLSARLESNANLLLLVDQFEEIFAFRGLQDDDGVEKQDFTRRKEKARRKAEASDFVDLLLKLAEQRTLPIYVTLTMRTDFLGDCDLFYGLPEALNRGRYLVPRMTREQLRDAIECPALLLGGEIAPRLLDHVLNELGDRFDRLPVLQHALLRTWDERQRAGGDRPVDFRHFELAGGLEGALDQDAESALKSLDEHITAQVFRRLTDTDTSQRRVRSPARISELMAAANTDRGSVLKVIRSFEENSRSFVHVSADGVPEDPRVDISHESLIRQWTRLRNWVDEERRARDEYRELVKRARKFERRETGVLQDPELQMVLDWKEQTKPLPGWAQRYSVADGDFDCAIGYLEASEKKRRTTRLWTRGIAASFVVFLVAGSAVMTDLAFKAENRFTQASAVVGSLSRIHALLEPIEGTEDVRRELLANQNSLSLRVGAANKATNFWKSIADGDAQRRKEDFGAARAAYSTAHEIAKREGADPVWQHSLYISALSLGDTEIESGEVENARGWYAEALMIAKQLVQAEPGNPQGRRDLAAVYVALGSLESRAGDRQKARDAYDQALETTQQLAQEEPGSRERQRDLLLRYRNRGGVELVELEESVSNLGQARDSYNEAQEIAERLARADPNSAQAQRDRHDVYRDLGDLEYLAGNRGEARDWYNRALQVAEQIAADPGGYLSIAYTRLAKLEESGSDREAARDWYMKALDLEERQADVDKGSATRQRNLSISYLSLAQLEIAEGHAKRPKEAREWCSKAREIAEALAETDPRDADTQLYLVQIYFAIGGVEVAIGDRQTAREWYERALAIAERLAEDDPENQNYKDAIETLESANRELGQ